MELAKQWYNIQHTDIGESDKIDASIRIDEISDTEKGFPKLPETWKTYVAHPSPHLWYVLVVLLPNK